MRRVVLFALILVAVLSTQLLAQSEEVQDQPALDIEWGVGLRFPPSTIAYTHPFLTDSALISAFVGRLWVQDLFGIEAGGWFYHMRDNWAVNTNRVLTAGVLYKAVNGERVDLIAAARGISYLSRSTSHGYECEPPMPEPTKPDREPEGEGGIVAPPYCGPIYEIESRSLTLAGMLTMGLEWRPTAEVGIDLEFGVVYSQMISENNYPQRPIPIDPLPDGRPIVPPPPPGSETFSSSQLGVVVAISLLYHF